MGSVHTGLGTGLLFQPLQLLSRCRRVEPTIGTALSPGKSLGARPPRQAWGKVASVAVGQASLGARARGCSGAEELTGCSEQGVRACRSEDALVIDPTHLGTQCLESRGDNFPSGWVDGWPCTKIINFGVRLSGAGPDHP